MSSKSTKNNCICQRCGKEFHCKPSRIAIGKGRFCSVECRSIKRTCATCGEEFLTSPSSIENRAAIYCSFDCRWPERNESIEDKFISRVGKETETGCIPWKGTLNDNGYGILCHNGKNYGAHRLSYELMVGPIPEGLFVCHDCPGGDNPLCINPDHLFVGTQDDNMKDKVKKGRQQKGENVNFSKLTKDVVIEIRQRYKLGESRKSIATDLNTTAGNVWMIATRKTWKHIK